MRLDLVKMRNQGFLKTSKIGNIFVVSGFGKTGILPGSSFDSALDFIQYFDHFSFLP